MAKERGLGKGLSALMGPAALQESQEGQGALTLPISKVQPAVNQPRKHFDDDALHDLADSIRIHGIIQPPTVRLLSSGYYQIIAGERRWRAAKLAGLKEIPVVIVEADDRKAAELALIENLQREDLNPIEEAAGYRALIGEYGLTQEQAAQQVGKSRPAVANALRLLELPDAVRALLEEGRLTAGHARALLSLPDASLRRSTAQKVTEGGLSVRQTEELVKRILKGEGEKPAKAPRQDPYKMYRDAAAKDLSDRLGRRVSIVQGAKKGRIELEYYDDNDLNALLEQLEKLRTAPAKPVKKGGKA